MILGGFSRENVSLVSKKAGLLVLLALEREPCRLSPSRPRLMNGIRSRQKLAKAIPAMNTLVKGNSSPALRRGAEKHRQVAVVMPRPSGSAARVAVYRIASPPACFLIGKMVRRCCYFFVNSIGIEELGRSKIRRTIATAMIRSRPIALKSEVGG